VRIAAFLDDLQHLPPHIHLVRIELRDCCPAHVRFDQGIDDGTVAIRTIPLPPRPLSRLVAFAILRASSYGQEQIRRIQEAPPLRRREGPFHLQARADG
jgi:hypothetical protein